MKDTAGREYAKLSELKAGDIVQVDDGMTCINPWETRVVISHEAGLFIKCSDGSHFLDGQLLDDGESLVGIYEFRH